MAARMDWWERYEGPTWLVAAIIYAGWFALTWFHARIPWWLLVPLGAGIVAWHGSLQHETIHALVHVPRRLRSLLAWPPLGLGFPYPMYVREHRRHHRNDALTDPARDPESFYHSRAAWQAYHPLLRGVWLFNQTAVGRIALGAPLQLVVLAVAETRRLRAGDRSNCADWLRHAAAVGVLFAYICGVAKMSPVEYIGAIALPGLCLGMLRTLVEHRSAALPAHRTAIVENDLPFGLLFLYNNLHAVHHESPSLPWYKIRGVWRARRADILARNGGFHFPGYGSVLRRWCARPFFVPCFDAASESAPPRRSRDAAESLV